MQRGCTFALGLLGACALPACGDDATATPFVPTLQCPSSACPDDGQARLQAAFAHASINPTRDNASFDPLADLADWQDLDCNDTWNLGETANPRPNGVWLFGRDSGRPALGVHEADGDGLEARTIVLRSHGITLSVTELDLGGYFHEQIEHIRQLVREAGDHVDLVLVGSTHTHEAPDTVGLWGRDDQHSGVDARWEDFIDHAVAGTIHDALGRLEDATLTIGQARTEDAGSDMSRYVGDSRDPVVIDNMLTLLLFRRPDQTPITALVNWSAHPDDTNGKNHLLSAGYPHYLRSALEQGFARMGTTYPALAPGVLFMEGQVGGQIGPSGQVHAVDDSGQSVVKCQKPQHPPAMGCPDHANPGTLVAVTPDDCFAFEKAIAHGVATFAHQALAQGALTIADVPLHLRTKTFLAHVDNTVFQVAFLAGLISTKPIYGYDHSRPIDMDTNRPEVETELAYVELGPASFVTVPGELHPELFVGGYDGSRAGNYAIIKPHNPNPPDLSKAPPPPYVCDLMQGDFRFALGLTGDFLGYIMPAFNFEVAAPPSTPFIDKPPGDHYEETRSIGQQAETELIGTLKQLVTYGTPGTATACPGR
jgi:hypothetical protein